MPPAADRGNGPAAGGDGEQRMLVPTLLRDAPIYDSLREHTLRRERVLQTESAEK
jgi:hypothetical protein